MLKNKMDLSNKTILVTGAAGFIGSNLVLKLLEEANNVEIVGIDNMNDYYDVSLKEHRLQKIADCSGQKAAEESSWTFIKCDIANKQELNRVFAEYEPQVVVHLAAQAGVRYSISNPEAYLCANLIGFFNILEACRNTCDGKGVEHLVFASSSSVYGKNESIPYRVEDKTDRPVSLYAATKKSNELMAYSYATLYKIPMTGLRFFTVYGPAGRPDMAYFSFTNKLRRNETIEIFNYGNCQRDFTYVDDIVEGVFRVMMYPPEWSQEQDETPYRVYNIGNHTPVQLTEFVETLKDELIRAGVLAADYDLEAHMKLVPMQKGDVATTFADVDSLINDFGFAPKTSLREGLRRFAEWYKDFYMQ